MIGYDPSSQTCSARIPFVYTMCSQVWKFDTAQQTHKLSSINIYQHNWTMPANR